MNNMKGVANWVCHRNKIPIDPRTGKPAKSNDKSTWGSYTQARAYMGADKSISGIGFMFSHSPYVGIDIDHCITDRKLSDFAKEVIQTMKSYTELSPSGTGIHIICKGELPGAGRKNSDIGLEMYDAGRYFTVTEKALKGRDVIENRQNEIELLYQKYFDVPKKQNYQQQTLQRYYLEDDKIIDMAGRSQNGSKFLSLYTGDWQSYYKSQSEADLSFCNMLAFWTGCDDVQMDRIFRASGLMREKWDKKHGINTYGDMTITKAIDCCDTIYQSTPTNVRKAQTAQKDFSNNNVEIHTELQQSQSESVQNHSELQQNTDLQKSLTKNSELSECSCTDHSLDRFHKFNAKGQITGVFDVEIVDYIIENNHIITIGDMLYLYRDGVYQQDTKGKSLKYSIQHLIYREFQNSRTINRIYELILIQPSIKKQYWELNQFPNYYINFQNGMLNVQTMELLPHSPEYFAMNQIPHEYKALTKADLVKFPNSQHFLKTSLNMHDIKTIFQYMGICLSHNMLYQVFLMLLGEGANGKSILIDIFNAVVGEQNTSSLSMDKLTQRFYSAQLVFKLINTCADISKISIDDDAELKKIIGGDMIQAEFKGKDSFSFRPYAKMLFSANRFPYVDDRSEGFKRRLRVIEMNKKPPKKDVHLKEKLLQELDFWIFTAIQGLQEVLNNHDIFESDNSKKMREDIYKNGDSVYSFITDCLQPQQGHTIKRADMFREYDKYCQYCERARVRKRTFFDEMKAKNIVQKRDNNGNYVYKDIAFTVWEYENDVFSMKN